MTKKIGDSSRLKIGIFFDCLTKDYLNQRLSLSMRKIVIRVTALIALLLAHSAIAQDSLSYAELGYGAAIIKNTKAFGGFEWNGSGGYKFNPHFAIETGYTEINGTRVLVRNVKSDSHFCGIDLLGKIIFPLNQQYNLFVKIGAMNAQNKILYDVNASSTQTRIVPELGAGLSHSVAKNFLFTLESVTTLASTHNTAPASYAAYTGLSYKFSI